MNIPADLKYTKDHEWVSIEGDVATVGITDFAQGELGDIVYVEVETVDETLEKDEIFGDGWMIKIKISDMSQVDGLLSADAYNELIGA